MQASVYINRQKGKKGKREGARTTVEEGRPEG